MVLGYDAVKRKSRMRIEVAKKLFTVDDYYRMAEAGILGPEDRVELIDGEIIEMSPIGSRHARCVSYATELFIVAFRGQTIVRVQDPLRLSNYTEPEPDIVLLKPRKDRYISKHPEGTDTLLVVEVADTTLRYDRNVKLPRYAAAGVPEVWIENLKDDLLLVYREPAGKTYKASLSLRRDEAVSVLAFPGVTFKVEDLLG